jgi:hypothetical protein
MNITLLNAANVEVLCFSINDAEIKSSVCIGSVRVKVVNGDDILLFDFDANTCGFYEALTKTKDRIEKQKMKNY